MPRRSRIPALAHRIDRRRAEAFATRFSQRLVPGSQAYELAVLIASAYPALAGTLEAAPEIIETIAAEGHQAARDRSGLMARLRARIGEGADAERVGRELRRFAKEERLRIALRELLPPSLGGADVDVTSHEIADLADVTIEVALEDAVAQVSARFGPPRGGTGAPARFVVLGMGKLGGGELNIGSDVDLVFFYDTDEGESVAPDGSSITLHDFWSRVARRLTATLEDVTADGWVWRVDLRLRPEGRSGPLVNSVAAAERYYESFGRTWERAALLRARPVAGDRALGDEVLAILDPFVWRRRVDPSIAVEMLKLVQRSRVELSGDAARDLKLGEGGIREAEFFVQTLLLVWGGREARLRAKGTLDALRRLRAAGLVTDREAREIAEAYLALRRAEHAVQVSTGQQTHLWPDDPEEEARLSRALGFSGPESFRADLARHRGRVAERFRSLVPDGAPAPSRWSEAIAALDDGDAAAFSEAFCRAVAQAGLVALAAEAAAERWADVARDVFELSRRPDAPLGARSREAYPLLGEALLDAVVDAAAPEQAARTLRMLFARLRHPGVYLRFLGEEPRAVRRLVEAVGGSAFLGEALVNNPELGDRILFSRGVPVPEAARAAITEGLREASDDDDPDERLVGALRRAKAQVLVDVGLADLASELGPREVGYVLSELADASLDAATRHALGVDEGREVEGLCVLAVGTLGGREIGYGSDLDVLFLFDPSKAPAGSDPDAYYARAARRVIRLISILHPAGRGYELDTRLRPSGNQGLLVTSIDAFARYHGHGGQGTGGGSEGPETPHVGAAVWERLALLRARMVAGDRALGARAIEIAHAAAYAMPGDPARVAEELHRLRRRMEQELSQERRGRYDLKLGRGGLFEIELCVQFLQMQHGADPRVRTTETAVAIEALGAGGYLPAEGAETLRDGYAFLRKLQGRIRIVHADAGNLVEESAPGLLPLARRMGIRDRPGAEAAGELLERYRVVTGRVREVYQGVLGGGSG
ncbi:bifunctional [glutamate--ammonia ligase]-adenylyl-L-tyrosine phosphorylase/[glutamate--ammonia-ligase] adenylyltransferase [Polyangium aurulentum]|uniref:bifunctional [glutamate--ammonia ligase]-adenylyl-L-tyrosine phosphorylase/[glutamate--ammonia-ligase] adenylyltransferase n=1 Tax=Polyangium aurulentum TaxID=2567896 RepID=UPI0010ADEFB4|nr:bifunctional [glutamate--ammonia ligase]-adenylyl-L-tyrosine phosphorylase/[glutamate--ammonia-ligase] adenylyltransferase [Polyangium aurulentum]UQA55213.1 bifunctional [glutamate--ammonia ligase]-adenylyl-L-tyrosine phosphorylase/[glutamate--ammonia-ligase] adenylyltransferase [Polyangium aurulentum]